MKHKPFTTLLLLLFFSLPTGLVAEEKKKPFTLNSKPVPDIVARVNGIPLHSMTLEHDLFAFRAKQRPEKEVKPADEVALARKLVKVEVGQELIAQKAKSLGIDIDEKQIDLQLRNVEEQFPNHEAFLTALAFQHLSVEALREKIRRTLLEDELVRREIAPKVEVNDVDVEKYYNSNKALFNTPALYRASHIYIAALKPSANIEDEASRKKAERLTKMINAESEEEIHSILKKVEAGEDFAKLAKLFSEDKTSRDQGGQLGKLHPDNTLPEIGKELVKLKEGGTSGILKSQFGFHILKLDEIIPSQLIPVDEAQTDIMQLLLRKKTRHLFQAYLADLVKQADVEILF